MKKLSDRQTDKSEFIGCCLINVKRPKEEAQEQEQQQKQKELEPHEFLDLAKFQEIIKLQVMHKDLKENLLKKIH